MEFVIDKSLINLDAILDCFSGKSKISLSSVSKKAVVDCRTYLENVIEQSESPIYGVNTGFGSLRNKEISKEQISELQKNLVLSHSCGMGDTVDIEIVRLMMLLKIVNLSLGHSGIRLETIERLIFMYNNGIIPVVYEQGSLGASGDLAPLAHLSLPLIGAGEVWVKGERKKSSDVLKELKLQALVLGAKEGLALLNGTQFMSSYAAYILYKLNDILPKSELVTAASIDAFDASLDPFSPEIQHVRPHNGQKKVAESIRKILNHSPIATSAKQDVQDPYSFRCIPQVHGASLDAIDYVRNVVNTEVSSVTDNPMVFPEEDRVISAGNFHGQPLALALDFLAIALAELASISERRIYKLISGQRDLPPFLISNPGLNSGFMIPQYTAASIVSQNKQLCTPASVDTIDSSNGQEDHVSMGANAALKCKRVLDNYIRVLGIELMNASQALAFRKPLKSSAAVEAFLSRFRKEVPFLEKDAELHVYMHRAQAFLLNAK
ncbi:MAG TPA: histidine ammonia-lyase [Flavobacteriales bacterium]|nr:histidine ammonia-lyase [Flavobacteriales bacterium]